MSWQLVQTFSEGKKGSPDLNEDSFTIKGPMYAVIDGATDKSGKQYQYEGKAVSSGRFASLVVKEALEKLKAGVSPRRAVDEISEILDRAIKVQYPDIKDLDRPSVRLAVFDSTINTIWWISDCWHALVDTDGNASQYQTPDPVDEVLIPMRSLTLTALQTAGTPWIPESGSPDPGREAIMPLLKQQPIFANRVHKYGYGIVNGTFVPSQLIGVQKVSNDINRIVLASDGYPSPIVNGVLSLAVAEAHLHSLLAQDRLCIGPLAGTKGMMPGQISHDDRTWIELLKK